MDTAEVAVVHTLVVDTAAVAVSAVAADAITAEALAAADVISAVVVITVEEAIAAVDTTAAASGSVLSCPTTGLTIITTATITTTIRATGLIPGIATVVRPRHAARHAIARSIGIAERFSVTMAAATCAPISGNAELDGSGRLAAFPASAART